MIPKTIHYCWFGGKPLPKMAKKCIKSWKRVLPDYEIKEWNESNFDVNLIPYTAEAYSVKKYAFVADVARIFALIHEGGIYMDTDVELLQPIGPICDYDAVFGFETKNHISTGFMGCRKNHPILCRFMDEYKELHFVLNDGSFDTTTNVKRLSRYVFNYGFLPNGELQIINNNILFPQEYFSPKDFYTKRIILTPNSICIHHFDASWVPLKIKINEKIALFLGPHFTNLIKEIKARLFSCK